MMMMMLAPRSMSHETWWIVGDAWQSCEQDLWRFPLDNVLLLSNSGYDFELEATMKNFVFFLSIFKEFSSFAESTPEITARIRRLYKIRVVSAKCSPQNVINNSKKVVVKMIRKFEEFPTGNAASRSKKSISKSSSELFNGFEKR